MSAKPRREIPKVEGAPVEHGVVPRPSPAAETPAAKPASERPAKPVRKPARAEMPAETPAELSKDERARWRWLLGATGRKGRAALDRADEAVRAWEDVVADARRAGVPDRMLMAAALEADMDLPAAE